MGTGVGWAELELELKEIPIEHAAAWLRCRGRVLTLVLVVVGVGPLVAETCLPVEAERDVKAPRSMPPALKLVGERHLQGKPLEALALNLEAMQRFGEGFVAQAASALAVQAISNKQARVFGLPSAPSPENGILGSEPNRVLVALDDRTLGLADLTGTVRRRVTSPTPLSTRRVLTLGGYIVAVARDGGLHGWTRTGDHFIVSDVVEDCEIVELRLDVVHAPHDGVLLFTSDGQVIGVDLNRKRKRFTAAVKVSAKVGAVEDGPWTGGAYKLRLTDGTNRYWLRHTGKSYDFHRMPVVGPLEKAEDRLREEAFGVVYSVRSELRVALLSIRGEWFDAPRCYSLAEFDFPIRACWARENRELILVQLTDGAVWTAGPQGKPQRHALLGKRELVCARFHSWMKLAATVDSAGRVVLFDVESGAPVCCFESRVPSPRLEFSLSRSPGLLVAPTLVPPSGDDKPTPAKLYDLAFSKSLRDRADALLRKSGVRSRDFKIQREPKEGD